MTPILLVSINCLFSTLIWIIVVAIFVALAVWALSAITTVDVPPIIPKLLIILGVVICVYFLVVCLTAGHPAIMPGP